MKNAALLVLCTAVICFGCNSYETKYPYTLKDFKPELRKHLHSLINNNGYNEKATVYLRENLSIKELQRILKSDHPLLRTIAFDILCHYKDGYIANEDLINNLNDTALLSGAKFGEARTVASEYVYLSQNRTTITKDSFFSILLNKYPYLDCIPYLISTHLKNKEKYCQQIRDITSNNYWLQNSSRFNLILELSNFNEYKDTNIIYKTLKENILEYHYENKKNYFIIIKNSPKPKYFGIVQEYFEKVKHREENYRYDEWINGKELLDYENFLVALLAYENNTSTRIIKEIIKNNIYPNFKINHSLNYENRIYYKIFKSTEKSNYKSFKQINQITKQKALLYYNKIGKYEDNKFGCASYNEPETNYW